MRTFDRNYLSTHPVGEPAVISLSVAIPASANVPLNADGTPASITLKATGENYLQVIQTLSTLNEMPAGEIIAGLLMFNTNEAQDAILEAGDPVAINQMASEIIVPFRTFELDIESSYEAEDGAVVETTVSLEVTAPAFSLAGPAIVSMTRSKILTSVAVGLCPETFEDEFGDDNEVLVMP